MKRLLSILLTLCLVLTMVPGIWQTAAADPAPEEDFTYEITDGKATVTGYNGSGGDVVIPDTLGGSPVTAIGDYAFYGNGGLVSVTIPDTVTSIGYMAFAYCDGLTAVTIPEGVTYISSRALCCTPGTMTNPPTCPGSTRMRSLR